MSEKSSVFGTLGPSTPVSETLAGQLGYIKAAILSRVYYYQQLEDGACKASVKTLSAKLGIATGSISKNLAWLVKNNYLVELNEHYKGNHSNSYRVGSKFYDITQRSPGERCNVQEVNVEQEERSPDERNVHLVNDNVQEVNEVPQKEANNVHLVNDNVHQMNGEEVVVVDVVSCLPPKISFEEIWNRWDNAFGEKLKPNEVKIHSDIIGDFFDERPEWTFKAVNETLSAVPLPDAPLKYFKRIINGWIKLGQIPEREPAQLPPQEFKQNGHKNGYNGRGHSQPNSASSQDVKDEPWYDRNTNELVYSDGHRVSSG